LALVEDQDTKLRILAHNLFPNDPNGLGRVGFDAHGQPVYVGDDNKLHKVASGTTKFGANALAYSPEMVAGTVGLFGGFGSSAALAGGANILKRQIAGPLLGEPYDPASRLKTAAVEGVSAELGTGAGRALAGVRDAGRPAIEYPAEEIARATAVRNRVFTNTRIRLNLADASDDPFIKSVYQYGWRQPGQASRDLRADRTMNDLQYAAETDRVLNLIAHPETSERTGQAALDAAQEAMRRAQARANNIADPYYHAAWDAHPIVRDPTVLSFFNFPGFGEAYDRGLDLARMERVPLRPFQPPSLRTMDYWLRALKEQSRTLRPTNATMAGAMDQRIGELDTALQAAYPELQQARTVYRTARMALVEPLENGKVGALADIPDPQARTAAAQIFADKNVSSQHIAETRRAIESVNPQAWRGVVRQWLASKWDDALQRTQSGEQRNAAGKMQAEVFGTPHDEEIAQAMLTPAQYNAFNELMFAARRLGSTPVGGSTTPQDLAIGKALEGNINPVMEVVSGARHPFKSAEDVARKAGREQNILHLTSALLDPNQSQRLAVITRMRPGRRQALLLSTLMSEEAAKRFLQTAAGDGKNSELIAGHEDAVGE